MQNQTTKEFCGKKILIIVENLPSPFDRRVWQEATALRDKGAVKMRKDGQHVFYSITNDKFIKGCSLIREGIIETFVQKAKFIDIK